MKAMADKQIILVVDDTPANIEVAHNTLKDTYIVKIATSGAKALKFAKVLPQPDLILLDVMMPEMDGYEVCIGLKSDPSTSDTPIIFLTGKIDAEGTSCASGEGPVKRSSLALMFDSLIDCMANPDTGLPGRHPDMRREASNSARLTTFTNRSHLLWFRRAFGHTLRARSPRAVGGRETQSGSNSRQHSSGAGSRGD